VEADIETYAGWGRAWNERRRREGRGKQDEGKGGRGGMALEGILLDETPNHWSAEREEYLERLARKIRGSEGFVGDRLVSGDLFYFSRALGEPACPKLGFLDLISSLILS
jgi:hypothetical protein